jgi:sulfur carrier protein
VIALIINGEPREFEAAMKVAQLVERLGLAGRKIALERNGEIVPRSQFGEQSVVDGDRVEIVVAVGGG